jgi:hypothetical protein
VRCAGVALLVLGSVLVRGGMARAAGPIEIPEAIEVDRDAPPPGRVELGFDSGAPVDTWGVGIQLGYVDRPIALADAETGITRYPVDHRETLALGGALALGDRLLFDVRMPFDHQVGTRWIGLGDNTPLERFVLGELTLGARMRISATEHLQTFVRGQVDLPSGNDENFAGDPRTSYQLALIGRVEPADDVVIAATAGYHIRSSEVQVADRVVGDELFGAIGATVGLPPIAGLWCKRSQVRALAELVGVLGDNVDHALGPSPAEMRLGVIVQPTLQLAIGVRAGVGLNDQIGAPRVRAMLELAWQPQATGKPRAVVAPPPTLLPSSDDDDDD